MKKKVLLVEDTGELRKLLKLLLMRNYEVETAKNGIDALNILSGGFEPDIIISDLMMPELDGTDLVTQIKSSGMYNHIPVIILSTMDQSALKVKLFKVGADDYMIKPFNPAELEIRIENQLRKSN